MKGAASAPTVEALVARCLTDPVFLEAAVQDTEMALAGIPESVRREAEGLDFRKLWRFSGFIGKVQHNYLWEQFPATRRLLWRRGIEHTVFGQYRKQQLDPIHAPADRPGRIAKFVSFFSDYLLESRDELARTVFTHERILWELRSRRSDDMRTRAGSPSAGDLNWRDLQRLVPGLSANVHVARFAHSPEQAIACVLKGDDPIVRVRRKRIALIYRLDDAREVRISEVDAVSAALLTAVRGTETVQQLIARIRRAGLQDLPPRAFRGVFEEAARAGILQLEARPCV